MASRVLKGIKRSTETKKPGSSTDTHLCFVRSDTLEALFDAVLLKYADDKEAGITPVLFSENYRKEKDPSSRSTERLAQKYALLSLRYQSDSIDLLDPLLSSMDLQQALKQKEKLLEAINPGNFGVDWEHHAHDHKCPSTRVLVSLMRK